MANTTQKKGANMGIVLDVHTMISDRECTKLRFLVDSGATECLIRQDVVPWLSVRSRDKKIALKGLGVEEVVGGSEEISLYLQLTATYPEGKTYLKTPTTLILAELEGMEDIDGVLSYQWMANRHMILDPMRRCLTLNQG